MKFDIISSNAVPGRGGSSPLPEHRELYQAIGKLDVNQSIRIVDKTELQEKLRNSLSSSFSSTKGYKKYGFKIKIAFRRDVPSEGFSTIYLTKVKTEFTNGAQES